MCPLSSFFMFYVICNCHWTLILQGYSGSYCEFTSSACESGPCLHGGTCQPQQDGYLCVCPAGASGEQCEEDITNECQSSPCTNNGQCLDRIGKLSVIEIWILLLLKAKHQINELMVWRTTALDAVSWSDFWMKY